MDSRTVLECDIAVIGGGLGGVAAALAACEAGTRVILTEATDWIGGQVTSQLVSALDEHRYIESFGGTRSYYHFREAIREVYHRRYFTTGGSSNEKLLNPGGGWISALCFEPRVGLEVLQDMLAPHIESGRLQILLNHTPWTAHLKNGHLYEVICIGPSAVQIALQADYFLDATELGDLLPLVGIPYATGAEAVEGTGEPHASADGPHPDQVQSFTSCFILEHRPGEDHTISKPARYEFWRDTQPFRLNVPAEAGGPPIHYPVFNPNQQGQLTFWTYRRIFDSTTLSPGTHDMALINWDSNDYRGGNLIDTSPLEQNRLLAEARELSRSFLYWLQTEVPRDDNRGRGYPGLRLVPSAAGTPDGFGKFPYIRESRRILGLTRIREQDIVQSRTNPSARARPFSDSAGVGWYPIDVHACCNGPMPDYRFDPSLPYQIPLSALVTPALPNLLAAAKNLSVTHLTNGAYRLHPVEWNIGESAGTLAAYCIHHSCAPVNVCQQKNLLDSFQDHLLNRGIPLAWAIDTPLSSPDFFLLQKCLVHAPFGPGPGRGQRLDLRPEVPITHSEAASLMKTLPAAENPALDTLLSTWLSNPTEPLAGMALRHAFSLLSIPTSKVTASPTYREFATIIGPYL